MGFPDRDEIEPPFRDLADERAEGGPLRFQQVAGFAENNFGGEHGFVECGDHLCAPIMPLVTQRKRAHERTGVDQVSY
jgi:hypothetical protein